MLWDILENYLKELVKPKTAEWKTENVILVKGVCDNGDRVPVELQVEIPKPPQGSFAPAINALYSLMEEVAANEECPQQSDPRTEFQGDFGEGIHRLDAPPWANGVLLEATSIPRRAGIAFAVAGSNGSRRLYGSGFVQLVTGNAATGGERTLDRDLNLVALKADGCVNTGILLRIPATGGYSVSWVYRQSLDL